MLENLLMLAQNKFSAFWAPPAASSFKIGHSTFKIIQILCRCLTLLIPLSEPIATGCYWLLGVAVGDGVVAGAGVTLLMSIRFFQTPSSRTAIDA
jgi:hypothetical protein